MSAAADVSAGGDLLPAKPKIVWWSRRLARGGALVGTALGAAVLILGWGLDLRYFRTLGPGGVPVRPFSAIGMVLLGACLWLLTDGAQPRRRSLGAAAAGLVVVIGALSLTEHATGVNLLRDEMVVRASEALPAGAWTEDVGIAPAFCLTLLALANLALVTGSYRAAVVSQALGLVAAFTGLITFDNLLHLGSTPEQIGTGWMPPLTAAGVTALAFGTVLARPQIGLTQAMTSDSVAGSLGRRMLLAAVTVPFLLGWTPALVHALGFTGRRLPDVLLLTASVVLFGVVSFLATSAAARLEAASIRVARQAQEGHDQLLALIDNTSAVIYVRDVQGRYILVNREYERLFEVEREKIVGLTDHDLFPQATADDFRVNDQRALAAEAPIIIEEEAPQDDGPHTYITVKFSLRDGSGVPYAVCGISTDITDRKRAEDEVQLLNAELENRVRERTEELQASASELDAFAYSVSHDLRAPLRSVDGFSQILLEDYADKLDTDAQDYLHRMRAGTQRMGKLIDDLLQLSRTTRVELHRVRVDLSELARATIAELRAEDPDRHVTVVIEDGLAAPGDRALLGLVMENLLSNAWKFTAKRPDARIEVGATWQDGQRVFQVRDNGAGFDMRYVAKLFGAFERLHSSADFEGTGIGLATVQRIVRRHGGDVRAEGVPGEGATFTFTLPSHMPAEPASGAVASSEPASREPASRLEHSH